MLTARLNVARLNASRLGGIRPITTRVVIGGTERVVDKAESRLQLTDGEPWTATLRVRGFTPTLGQEVLVGIGDTAAGGRVFAGRIVRRSRVVKARTAEATVWDIECLDPTWELDKKLVLASFPATSVPDLVQSLLTTYTSGFTLETQDALGTLAMDFTYERVSRCLSRICDAIGADWQVTPFKKVRLFRTDAKRPVPKTLDAACPYEFRDVTWSEDLSQVRTRVIVEGVRTPIVENLFTGFEADIQVAADSLLWRSFHVSGAGTFDGRVRQSTGTLAAKDSLPPAPQNFPGWLYMSGVAPQNIGDDLVLRRTYNDTTKQTALTALEGGDGIREHEMADGRLTGSGMDARGAAELELYGQPVQTLSFASRDPALLPGVDVTVNLDGLTGTYRVRSVAFDSLDDTLARYPLRRVEASSVRQDFYDVLRRIERAQPRN